MLSATAENPQESRVVDNQPIAEPAEGDRIAKVKADIGGILSWVWRPLCLFSVSRLAVSAMLGIATFLRPGARYDIFARAFDGNWYYQIATRGYDFDLKGPGGAQSTAFFPLFPVLIRIVRRVLGISTVGAGLVVVHIAGGLAVVLLWKLVRDVYGDRDSADRAATLFCFFPGSFVLSLLYSESVMLFFAVGTLLALHHHRWVLAGLAAALAHITRMSALAAVATCYWAGGWAILRDRQWRAVWALMLSPLGIVIYFTYLHAHSGRWDLFFSAEDKGWNQKVDFGSSIYHDLKGTFNDPFADLFRVVTVLSILFLVGSIIMLIRLRPPAIFIVYTLVIAIPMFISSNLDPRPRFLLAAFPIILPWAIKDRRVLFSSTLGVFGALLAGLTLATVLPPFLGP